MVVALSKGYVGWDIRNCRDWGEVDAYGLRRRKLSAEIAGDGAGTATHIEDIIWILDWRLENCAMHHRSYSFMLAIESSVFAWTDGCYLLRKDGRL